MKYCKNIYCSTIENEIYNYSAIVFSCFVGLWQDDQAIAWKGTKRNKAFAFLIMDGLGLIDELKEAEIQFNITKNEAIVLFLYTATIKNLWKKCPKNFGKAKKPMDCGQYNLPMKKCRNLTKWKNQKGWLWYFWLFLQSRRGI